MRKIKGYLIVCEVDGLILLFGLSVNDPNSDSESFETNDHTPFETLTEARLVASRIKDGRNDLAKATVNVGRVCLEIAESKEDLKLLQKKREPSFIVIYAYKKEVTQLLGEFKRGTTPNNQFDSGALITQRAAPFTDFKEAWTLRGEAERQGQSLSAIAYFCLRVMVHTHRLHGKNRR